MNAHYTVVDGQVIAEKWSGFRKLYLRKPLGSTVALPHKSQAQPDALTHRPYGEKRVRTRMTPTRLRFL